MHLLLNCWTQQLQTLLVHGSHDVEDTGQHLCDADLMYFLVNSSPPKLLEVAASNFAGAYAT